MKWKCVALCTIEYTFVQTIISIVRHQFDVYHASSHYIWARHTPFLFQYVSVPYKCVCFVLFHNNYSYSSSFVNKYIISSFLYFQYIFSLQCLTIRLNLGLILKSSIEAFGFVLFLYIFSHWNHNQTNLLNLIQLSFISQNVSILLCVHRKCKKVFIKKRFFFLTKSVYHLVQLVCAAQSIYLRQSCVSFSAPPWSRVSNVNGLVLGYYYNSLGYFSSFFFPSN